MNWNATKSLQWQLKSLHWNEGRSWVIETLNEPEFQGFSRSRHYGMSHQLVYHSLHDQYLLVAFGRQLKNPYWNFFRILRKTTISHQNLTDRSFSLWQPLRAPRQPLLPIAMLMNSEFKKLVEAFTTRHPSTDWPFPHGRTFWRSWEAAKSPKEAHL